MTAVTPMSDEEIADALMALDEPELFENELQQALILHTLKLIARVNAERARSAALENAGRALLARWELFTGPERGGWGNQEQAYYDLAKHAQAEWKALSAALTGVPDERKTRAKA